VTELDLEALYQAPAVDPRPLVKPQPVALGDIYAVPITLAAPIGGHPIPPGGLVVARDRLYRARHVITGDASVTWRPYRSTWRHTAGGIGILTIPTGGHALLTHRGGDHGQIALPSGCTLELIRQRQWTGDPRPQHVDRPVRGD